MRNYWTRIKSVAKQKNQVSKYYSTLQFSRKEKPFVPTQIQPEYPYKKYIKN